VLWPVSFTQMKKTRSSTPQMATKYPGDFLEGQSNNEKVREATALRKLEDIIRCRLLRCLGHLSRMDQQGLPRKALHGNTEISGGGQFGRDRTGKMSSRKISGKWASAGTRLNRLRTAGAGGIVSPNAYLTRDEPGTRNTDGMCFT